MSSRNAKTLVIVLALCAACGYASWLWLRSYARGAGRYTDGQAVYADTTDAPVRHAVWEPARALRQGINTPASESRPALSPDGRFLVFAAGERGLNTNLYRAEIVDGEPREPELIASIDTTADESSPAFSSTHLYFASDRAGGAGGLDLWRARYRAGGFDEPERLSASLQSSADDCDPAPSADDAELLFASNRAGTFDVYSAGPARAANGIQAASRDAAGPDAWSVQPIDALNTKHAEREPALTADGRALFFASDRDGAAGSFDLYRSALAPDGWCPPVALAGLNTRASERGPAPSADGFALYFARGADEKTLDLFLARSLELYQVPPVAIGWMDLAILASLLLLALMAALARQYAQLDFIYKCFLVSVLLHVLLLLWLRFVYMEGGVMPVKGEERHRVRLITSDRTPLAEHIERAGAVEFRRSERASDPLELTRANLDNREHEPTPREVASATLPPAPELVPDAASRERVFVRPTETHAEVALQDVASEIEQRVASAPELGLSAARLDAPRTNAEESAPARMAMPSSNAPSARPEAWTPVAPDPSTASGARVAASEPRANATSDLAPRSTASRAEIHVAAPEERLSRSAAPAPALALSPSEARVADARAERERGAPERLSSAAAPTTTAPGSALPKAMALSAIGSAPAPVAPPSRTTGEVSRSSNTQGPRVALDDHEAVVRRGAGTSGESDATDASQRDILASLTPSEAATGRATSTGTLERLSSPASTTTSTSGGANGSGSVLPKAAVVGELGAPPMPAAPPTRGSGDVLRPTSTDVPNVALEDHEAIVRRGAGSSGGSDANGAEPGASDRDILSSLATSDALQSRRDGAPARGDSASAPGQWNRTTAPAEIEAPTLAPAVDLPERAPDTPQHTRTTWEDTPYQNRAGEEKARALELHGGTKETEEAVARGLAYLARIAKPRGHWGDLDYADEKYGHVAVGKTGLALLAFLGAGHTQNSGTEYSPLVARTVAFLVSIQDEASGHFGDSSAYCHGIATYALAECLALTHDESLRAPLERAVEHILSRQSHKKDPRYFGGWGYYYNDDRTFDPWPRTSITAWQVMALESARLSGLTVPDQAFADARAFLRNARDDEGGFVRYNHDPERLNSGYPTLPASTPAGLFALSLVGEDITSAEFRPFVTFVLNRIPRSYRYTGDDDFVSRAQGNSYFWYYATLSMFRAGGRAWDAWNDAMKAMLLPAQQSDGSWKPIDIYARYAHDDNADRSYTTAMCVLSLEVYYRYYLPLLRVR